MSRGPSIAQTADDPLTFAIACPIPPNYCDGKVREILMRYPADMTKAEGDAMERDCAALFADTACQLFHEADVGAWMRSCGLTFYLDGRSVWIDRILLLTFVRPQDAMLFKLRWG